MPDIQCFKREFLKLVSLEQKRAEKIYKKEILFMFSYNETKMIHFDCID